MSLLFAVVAGEATPDIQLAGFDDLFKLATGSSARLVGQLVKCILHVNDHTF